MMAMAYGNVFVGQVAIGANAVHTIRTIRAAEAYRGTSLIIAYAHCIGQGINMTTALSLQKEGVACGYWPLYHFDPSDEQQPFHLDCKAPKGSYKEFADQQARFAILTRSKPEEAQRLANLAQEDIDQRWEFYSHLAEMTHGDNGNGQPTSEKEEVKK